ncbi:MAG: flagellar filament protein FlaA, partial [Spirochaetaceae bacterium]|nr:flagellar filament protein FlaA [Spirochaetaceae bacterium]
MKRALIFAILVLSATLLFAQQDPDPQDLGRDVAQQLLQEVSISKFEDAGFWRVHMPIDQGIIESRRFEGSPLGKEAIPEEEDLGIATPDDYVLGVKA